MVVRGGEEGEDIVGEGRRPKVSRRSKGWGYCITTKNVGLVIEWEEGGRGMGGVGVGREGGGGERRSLFRILTKRFILFVALTIGALTFRTLKLLHDTSVVYSCLQEYPLGGPSLGDFDWAMFFALVCLPPVKPRLNLTCHRRASDSHTVCESVCFYKPSSPPILYLQSAKCVSAALVFVACAPVLHLPLLTAVVNALATLANFEVGAQHVLAVTAVLNRASL